MTEGFNAPCVSRIPVGIDDLSKPLEDGCRLRPWGTKGLRLRKEKRDFFVFVWKDRDVFIFLAIISQISRH